MFFFQPAPHSVRHNLLYLGKEDIFSDILMQHLWGDMSDGADISLEIIKIWRRWGVTSKLKDACILPSTLL